MKRNGKIKGRYWKALMASALLPLFLSCSDQDVNGGEPEVPGNATVAATDFYLALNISTPEETRSSTTPDGGSENSTHQGLDLEGTIISAHIYFFNQTGGAYLAHFDISGGVLESYQNQYADLYAKVSLAQAAKIFKADKANVYVVANATPGLGTNSVKLTNGTLTEDEFLAATISATSLNGDVDFARPFKTSTSTGFTCPMSNKTKYEVDLSGVTIPEDATDEQIAQGIYPLFSGSYRDPEGNRANLWNISLKHGDLLLERSIARVDYLYHESAQVFNLTNTDWECKGPNGETVKLELMAMQLFNVSKEAWMFRHTSQGDNTRGYQGTLSAGFAGHPFNNENNNADYGKDITGDGEETGAKNYNYHWVVDTDWSKKTKENMNSPHFMTTSPGTFLNQSTVTEGTDRMTGETVYNWSISTASGTGTNGYTTYADLKTGNSSYASANRGYIPWHYVMENTLPTTEVMELPYATGVAFYLKVILVDGNGTEVDMATKYPYSASEPLRITRNDGYYQEAQYDTDKGGWYLTYKYLIEHNNDNTGKVDGNKGGKTDKAPMQIGIVRNNIYQLNITSISNLPDPHQPDNIDMTVDCFVLPWDVRWDDNVTLY